MIFEGRHIDEIQDQEFDLLVTDHYSERQSLEFKATYIIRDDENRLEVLRDIVSLANGGGGYLIVGIRDDGKGKAQKYEPISQSDAENIKRSIFGLCLDHIKERLDGLECDVRNIKSNPIVVFRVPASNRIPHMVSFNNKTDFFTRYHDGKREMTIGEIRELFTQDFFGRRLSNIENHLSIIKNTASLEQKRSSALKRMEQDVVPNLSTIEDGTLLHELALARFEKEDGNTPCLWLAITPQNSRHNLIDVDSAKVREIFQNPPGQRPTGWNMTYEGEKMERTPDGICRGKKDYDFLELLSNGHMEFWKTLDIGFCWRQEESEFKRRPQLYPIPVVEFPTSFLRLFREIVDAVGLRDSFIFTIYYRFMKGYALGLNTGGYRRLGAYWDKDKLFEKEHFRKADIKLSSDFQPDIEAFNVVKELYIAFGHTPNDVPFFDRMKNEFDFNFKQ
jgi:hypothetical protein